MRIPLPWKRPNQGTSDSLSTDHTAFFEPISLADEDEEREHAL